MAKVFEVYNDTASSIELKDFGIVIPAGAFVDLGDFEKAKLSSELETFIQNGDLVRYYEGHGIDKDDAFKTFEDLSPGRIESEDFGSKVIQAKDIADGTITDIKIASGISGSKIGSGINASNITTGTLPNDRLTDVPGSKISGNVAGADSSDSVNGLSFKQGSKTITSSTSGSIDYTDEGLTDFTNSTDMVIVIPTSELRNVKITAKSETGFSWETNLGITNFDWVAIGH